MMNNLYWFLRCWYIDLIRYLFCQCELCGRGFSLHSIPVGTRLFKFKKLRHMGCDIFSNIPEGSTVTSCNFKVSHD